MMASDDDYGNLQRVPTKRERLFGLLSAAVLSVLLTPVAVYFGVLFLADGKGEVAWVFVIFSVLCLLSLWSVYRFAFTAPRKLSDRLAIRLTYAFIVVGYAFLAASYFVSWRMTIHFLLCGVTAIGMGFANLARLKLSD